MLEIDKIDFCARERRSRRSLFFCQLLRATREKKARVKSKLERAMRTRKVGFYLCVCECDVHDCYILVIFLRMRKRMRFPKVTHDLSLSLFALCSCSLFFFFCFFPQSPRLKGLCFLSFCTTCVTAFCTTFGERYPHFNNRAWLIITTTEGKKW